MNDGDHSQLALEGAVLRGAVRGSLIGCVVLTALVASIMTYAGDGGASALGVGLFAAFWGGPGFGGMFGAVLAYDRVQRDLAASDDAPAEEGRLGLTPTSDTVDRDSAPAAA